MYTFCVKNGAKYSFLFWNLLDMSLSLFGLDLEAVSTFCLQVASQVILSNPDYWKEGGELTSRRQGQCHEGGPFHVLFLCLKCFSPTLLYLLYLVFGKIYFKEAQEDEGQASSFFLISPLVKSSQVCLHTALNESFNFKWNGWGKVCFITCFIYSLATWNFIGLRTTHCLQLGLGNVQPLALRRITQQNLHSQGQAGHTILPDRRQEETPVMFKSGHAHQ